MYNYYNHRNHRSTPNYDYFVTEREVANKIANGEYLTAEEEAVASCIGEYNHEYTHRNEYCGRRYRDI